MPGRPPHLWQPAWSIPTRTHIVQRTGLVVPDVTARWTSIDGIRP